MLFAYSGATGMLIGLVLVMPPDRRTNRLSGRSEGG